MDPSRRTADRSNLRLGLAVLLLGLASLFGVQAYLRMTPPAPASVTREAGPLRVVVSIPPLMWPVTRLVPEGSSVTLLIPAGASEHGSELTPSQVAAIYQADLVVMVGMGLEPRVKQIVDSRPLPWRRVVTFDNMDNAIGLGADHAHDHSHDDKHDHSHGEFDPHIWLDPDAMAAFADRLVGALTDRQMVRAVEPGADVDSQMFARAAEDLRSQCRAIDEEYRAALANVGRRMIVTHHNAFEYVARRYGLTVAAVIRPAATVEPTPGEVQAAVTAIRAHDLSAIFVEPQFSPEGAKRIAEAAGVKTLTLDPLGGGDWPAMMRANLAALVEGLSGIGSGVDPAANN